MSYYCNDFKSAEGGITRGYFITEYFADGVLAFVGTFGLDVGAWRAAPCGLTGRKWV